VTHEYTIALGGRIGHQQPSGRDRYTAIAWAADRVIAIGTDDSVRSISRGDSTFLDIRGCVVTAIPSDLELAHAAVREHSGEDHDIEARLLRDGVLDPGSRLEPGSLADLAFWAAHPAARVGTVGARAGLIAIVRDGAFTEGDEHRGPFSSPPRAP
jgi:hypothetical protein